MINNLELDLPSFYISKPLEDNTFKICLQETTSPSVIKKLYMLANDVRPNYYFMETSPSTGYFLTAKIVPTFAMVGKAREQIKKEIRLNSLLLINPNYKIKAILYKENNYEKIWEFEHITKNKNQIYKIIIDLKDYLVKEIN
tara:strand:+ start:2925 stop:3350 length:426 start_codon:yes stop_codon:yes gene_type:complete